jgi:lipoprotein NlpD
MTLKYSTIFWLCAALTILMLSGCRASGNRRAPVEDRGASSGYRAPVEDRGDTARRAASTSIASKTPVQREPERHIKTYVIKKGDTLYSIAFEHGLDYREVADQNNIKNPGAIQIGQEIQLAEADAGAIGSAQVSASAVIETKNQPKVAKLPYSEQAVAQIENIQQEPGRVSPVVVPPVASKVTIDNAPEKDTGADDAVQWAVPTQGKLIGGYSESANRKGIDIAGNRGQPVLASAAGKVVYSGSGLRGYGKLVIIKHNKTYLSAYAHNDKILVKEGQSVNKGQKIAEMGNSDADQVKLHFEIRKFGKPVDPAKYLSLPKS